MTNKETSTMQRRQLIQAAASATALGALAPLSAFAQALDQVKIFYGFPAGSAGDSVARRVAEKLAGTPLSIRWRPTRRFGIL